jgi:uncharacterized membrane protein YhaH (DUF805 family)
VQNNEGVGYLEILTSKGRLGRLRYFVYTLGTGMISIAILMAVVFLDPAALPFIASVVFVVALLITIFLTIQRCHDFNMTGWFSLVLLLIGSLIFYFIPGTKGSNKHGLQPPPNSNAIKITAFLLPTFFVVLGIVAVISIPAYQDFEARVADKQQHSYQYK